MGDKRYYKTHHYINGKWEEDLQDPPKDYDLAIFVCNKSEAADILKNKVSDSIIENIKNNSIEAVTLRDILKNKVPDSTIKNINDDNIRSVFYIMKNINDNNIRSVFEDYNDYKYISLDIFSKYYFRNELLNTNLVTPKIINIAIVIFEKEFYVFADDILIDWMDRIVDWINRVVDMFKQDVDKFKQEKGVLGSIFIYYFLFVLMSDLILMLKHLYMTIYYYSKKSRIITRRQIPTSWDQKIEFSILNDLTEMKDLILELRIYLTYIKEVLREIQPLFRETSEYYNKLSDIKEECDDELYKIEQNMQITISTMFLFTNFRLTNVLIILTIVSLIYAFINIFLQVREELMSMLLSLMSILLSIFDIFLTLIIIIVITIINLFYNE